MATLKKYNELNLKENIEVIRFSEQNSERKTAEKFNISKSTVNNLKKRKSEYFTRYEEKFSNFSRKRVATDNDEIIKLTFVVSENERDKCPNFWTNDSGSDIKICLE